MGLPGKEVLKLSKLKFETPNKLPSFLHVAIGGVSGSGKTHLLGTIGKGSKLLVFDTERGSETFRSGAFQNDPLGTEIENIHVIPIYQFNESKDMIYQVESVLDYLYATKNSDGYKLVALDSITELQERFISAFPTKDPRQAYMEFKSSIWNIIHKSRMIPVHFIATARLRLVQDEVDEREVIRFDVSPAAWSVISGLFSAIGLLSMRLSAVGNTEKRTLQFTHGSKFQGKDRYGLGTITNPNALDLIQKIGG